MTAVLHFRHVLALVKIEDRTRSQVLIGDVQVTGDFPVSLVTDRIYEFH